MSVAEDQKELSRPDTTTRREGPTGQVRVGVGEVKPVERDGLGAAVVEFDPGVGLTVIVDDPGELVRPNRSQPDSLRCQGRPGVHFFPGEARSGPP